MEKRIGNACVLNNDGNFFRSYACTLAHLYGDDNIFFFYFYFHHHICLYNIKIIILSYKFGI